MQSIKFSPKEVLRRKLIVAKITLRGTFIAADVHVR